MPKTFKPLTISGIEEGQLARDINAEFRDLQTRLCAYVHKWGDRAEGAKAELTIKVQIKAEDIEDGVFAVKSSMSSKCPNRPTKVTTAISDENEDGQVVLFGRNSGTTTEDPRQGRICTDDGRTVDPETGEAIETDADGVIVEN